MLGATLFGCYWHCSTSSPHPCPGYATIKSSFLHPDSSNSQNKLHSIILVSKRTSRSTKSRGFAVQNFLVQLEKYTENSVDFKKIQSWKSVNLWQNWRKIPKILFKCTKNSEIFTQIYYNFQKFYSNVLKISKILLKCTENSEIFTENKCLPLKINLLKQFRNSTQMYSKFL